MKLVVEESRMVERLGAGASRSNGDEDSTLSIVFIYRK